MLVQNLDSLAKGGCTVLSTIHQPSSEVFHVFAQLLVMHRGRMLYSGQTGALPQELA